MSSTSLIVLMDFCDFGDCLKYGDVCACLFVFTFVEHRRGDSSLLLFLPVVHASNQKVFQAESLDNMCCCSCHFLTTVLLTFTT